MKDFNKNSLLFYIKNKLVLALYTLTISPSGFFVFRVWMVRVFAAHLADPKLRKKRFTSLAGRSKQAAKKDSHSERNDYSIGFMWGRRSCRHWKLNADFRIVHVILKITSLWEFWCKRHESLPLAEEGGGAGEQTQGSSQLPSLLDPRSYMRPNKQKLFLKIVWASAMQGSKCVALD